MMQDGKALQAGTSHFLGQNFAKASEIQFLNREGERVFAWTTSWGVSTRLIGALIMCHSDDDGLVLPPRLAPEHVHLFPIYRTDEEKTKVLARCEAIRKELNSLTFGDTKILARIDDRDLRGGEKVWQCIKKGVPLRLEIGPRDLESQTAMLARRDRGAKDKVPVAFADLGTRCQEWLLDMQKGLYEKALAFRKANLRTLNSLQEFKDFFSGQGGFAACHWDGGPEAKAVLDPLSVTARNIPFGMQGEQKPCLFSGRMTSQKVIFAKAY
jgi:prolyl-tRNA synthetase